MNRFCIYFTVLLLASLSGCSTTSRTATVPDGFDFQCETEQAVLYQRLKLANKMEESGTFNLLLLSGGGARGAWGAGYLKGWAAPPDGGQSGQSTIPKFDVVTGVSTGALQATHAFLGEYDELYTIYIKIRNEQVWRKRSLLGALFSNSLLESEPLAKYIDKLVNRRLLERVAENFDGRLLCVGAVNLQTGKFREWDLTRIAKEYEAADVGSTTRDDLLNLYRTVLLGSAAIPVAFPPVEILEDGNPSLYVDGGTRENVFIAFGEILKGLTKALPTTRLYGNYSGQRMVDYLPIRNYVVVNGQLGVAPADVENRLFSIAGRSFEALMAQSANGALYQIAYELSQVDQKANMKTLYSYIPPEVCLSASALDFDPAAMKELADLGANCGVNGKWFEFEPNSSLPICTGRTNLCE